MFQPAISAWMRLLIASWLIATCASANALQILEGALGKKHLVRVPARELTRLSMEEGRLQSMRFLSDELEVTQDKDNGSVYLKPRLEDKQISVFVLSSSGMSHELILQPVANMPLESVVIREPAAHRLPKAGSNATTKSSDGRASSLDQAVKRLVVTMAKGEAEGPGFTFERANQQLALWQDVTFTLVGRFKTRTHVGDSFTLVNTGPRVLAIAEQEFYRQGVIAVVVDQHLLRPGESTAVYVIRGGEDE